MPPSPRNFAPVWPDRPEFDAMPPSLRALAGWKSFAKDELLFAIGDLPQSIFYIVSGEARLRRHSIDGTEMVMQRASNAFLAEASLESPCYHCDGVATAAVEALVFPAGEFRMALAGCPDFRSRWTSHLLREVRRARAQCERLGLRSAEARILHYLECECPGGRLCLTQTRKAWAAELGLSHEALYRALARLSRQGVLRLDGQLIERTAGPR